MRLACTNILPFQIYNIILYILSFIRFIHLMVYVNVLQSTIFEIIATLALFLYFQSRHLRLTCLIGTTRDKIYNIYVSAYVFFYLFDRSSTVTIARITHSTQLLLYLYTYIEGTYRGNHNIDVDFIIIIFTEYRSTRLYIKYIAWNKLFFMFRVIQLKIIFHAIYYNMF